MKRISAIIGLCLVAAFAISAVAAATASAVAPELLLKLTTEGSTFPATFTSKGIGAATLKTEGSTVTCEATTDTGSLENAHLGKTTILFEKCSTEILGHKGPCGNENPVTKEKSTNMITLSNWVTHFGSALKEKGVEASAVPGALILLPEEKFSFECTEIPIIGKATIKVTGLGVVGLLLTPAEGTPVVGTKYASLNLVFEEAAGNKGLQKHTEFLLPLESNKLMTGLQLTSENSFVKKSEDSAQISKDTLEKFLNSKGEATEVEIVQG